MPDDVVTEQFPEDSEPEIFVPDHQLPGVWANWARLNYSKHEFTIDFVRIDPFANVGVVVARVSGSELFLTHVLDAMTTLWQDLMRRSLPPEVDNEDA
ncbi:MAG TPA: hypothetical protein VF101_03970 [Gaiellaceae bacterium]